MTIELPPLRLELCQDGGRGTFTDLESCLDTDQHASTGCLDHGNVVVRRLQA